MKKILLTSLLLLGLSVTTLTAEVKVGKAFPTLSLVDQFDKKTEVKTKGSTTLMLSFEKDVSKQIKNFIQSQEENYLTLRKIHYISDISEMPSLVTSLFAIPKMKKFNFNISLIYDEKEAKTLIREEGKVTIVTLKDNKVMKIKFVLPEELGTVLK